MAIKKNIQLLAKLSLCCAIFLSTQSVDAFNFGQLTKAARMGFFLAQKIVKASALAGSTYWIVRSVLNNCIARHDTATYPAVDRLVVYTDGKVTVLTSPETQKDHTMRVTHEYGASDRSELSQIGFSEGLDQETNTLTVQGLLEKYRPGRLQRFVQWLFRLQPKRMLHHIIEVPNTTQVEITPANSARYTQDREQQVHVDSILGNVLIHTGSGNVLVEDTDEDAWLKWKEESLKHRLKEINTPDRPIERWTETHVPARPIERLTEIHTTGRAIVRNFIGDLRVFDAHELLAERHPQNHSGKVFLNGVEQPFELPHKERTITPADSAL